jgi:plastocyanin
MATGRRWLVVASGVALSWPAALIGSARAASVTVTLAQQQFAPKTAQILKGDSVTWKYESGGQHTVTFEDGPDYNPTCQGLLKTGCLDSPGETVSRTFDTAGEYHYYCKTHGAPGGVGMAGVVKVTAASAIPASTTTTNPARSSTTATTRPPSSTTTTTRPLSTSSTVVRSTTTTLVASTTTLTPGAAPAFDPSGNGQTGASQTASARGPGGGDPTTVAVIVALLLAVAAGGGVLLWRLRPGRSS